MDLVQIYTYFSGEDADDVVSKYLDKMVEERGNSPDSDNLRSNLLEVHSKMSYQVKDNLTNVLAPLLQISAPTKYHYWFAIFLDPRYGIKLKDLKTFHQSKLLIPKYFFRRLCPISMNTSWLQNFLYTQTPHRY